MMKNAKKNGTGALILKQILQTMLCVVCLMMIVSAVPAMAKKSSTDTDTTVTDDALVADDSSQTVDLVAVGDDLHHYRVYRSFKTSKGYNFDSLFKNVKEDIQAADLAVINQETMLVKKNYSSYPCFGTPIQLADAIEKAGFDVVTCATNHTMDKGTSSIAAMMKYWRKNFPDVTILGVHESQEDANEVKVVEKNGIKIAMLNYTYGLNGFRLPTDKSYMIDLLTNRSRIRKMIKKAKKHSDFVIVFAHWGTEYQYSPDASQKSWAQFFADEGVDLVIGSHPHVLEPIKKVKGKNGNTMICYYSLGNFVTGQTKPYCLLSGMAQVTIVKDKKGTRIKDYSMTPLVTHANSHSKHFTVYKLSDYTEELAKDNFVHSYTSQTFTLKWLKRKYRSIMNQ